MGLSIPACLASLAALALAEGSGVPYQPMTPPAAKMSGSAKPAEPAKTAPPSFPTMTAPRPYEPLPRPRGKASAPVKPAAPAKAAEPTKTAQPPAASAATAHQPSQTLPNPAAKAPPPLKAATPAKPAAPAKTGAGKGAAGKAVAPGPTPSPSTMVYVIRRTEDAWTVMDPTAIEQVPGGPIRRAYSVTVRRNLLNGGPPQPGYVRTLNEFDCDAMKFRWRTFTIYNRFGSVVVKQDNTDPAFLALGRGGEEEDIFRTVCDGGGGGSVVAAPSLGLLVIGLMQGWDEAAMASAMAELPPAPQPKPAAKPASKPRR